MVFFSYNRTKKCGFWKENFHEKDDRSQTFHTACYASGKQIYSDECDCLSRRKVQYEREIGWEAGRQTALYLVYGGCKKTLYLQRNPAATSQSLSPKTDPKPFPLRWKGLKTGKYRCLPNMRCGLGRTASGRGIMRKTLLHRLQTSTTVQRSIKSIVRYAFESPAGFFEWNDNRGWSSRNDPLLLWSVEHSKKEAGGACTRRNCRWHQKTKVWSQYAL